MAATSRASSGRPSGESAALDVKTSSSTASPCFQPFVTTELSSTASVIPQHNFVSPTPSSLDQQHANNVPAAISASMPCDDEYYHHEKRTRECSFSSNETSQLTAQHLPSQQITPKKKKRGNAYIAPRKVPSTFTSQMGSLVVPCSAKHANKDTAFSTSNLQCHHQQQQHKVVGFRRQLSGSKIEAFLGEHDAMDIEPESTRPRSMSF